MPPGKSKTPRARAKTMAASREPRFTFVNLSHPDELKDENTISRVRRLAMAHVGKARKIRNTHNKTFHNVFELDQPECSLPDTIALSRVGLETLDPFASYPFNIGSHASNLCDSCRSCLIICIFENDSVRLLTGSSFQDKSGLFGSAAQRLVIRRLLR